MYDMQPRYNGSDDDTQMRQTLSTAHQVVATGQILEFLFKVIFLIWLSYSAFPWIDHFITKR